MSTPKSPTTTKAGIAGGAGGVVAGIALLMNAVGPLLDGDTSTVPDWNAIVTAIGVILAGFGIGITGYVARDNNVRSEGTKIGLVLVCLIFLGGCCATERAADLTYVNMVNSASKSIHAEYINYVNDDENLDDDEKRIRRETVRDVEKATKLKLEELTR